MGGGGIQNSKGIYETLKASNYMLTNNSSIPWVNQGICKWRILNSFPYFSYLDMRGKQYRIERKKDKRNFLMKIWIFHQAYLTYVEPRP